jgi:hypothetical protein
MIQPMQANELLKTYSSELSQQNLKNEESTKSLEASNSSNSGIALAAKITAPMLDNDLNKRNSIEAVNSDNDLGSNNDIKSKVEQLRNMKSIAMKVAGEIQQKEGPSSDLESPAMEFKLVSQNIGSNDSKPASLNLNDLKIDTPGGALDAVNKLDIEINKLKESMELNDKKNDFSDINIGTPETKEIQIKPNSSKAEEIPNSKREEVSFEANSLKQKIEADAAGAMQAQGNITPQQTLALLK